MAENNTQHSTSQEGSMPLNDIPSADIPPAYDQPEKPHLLGRMLPQIVQLGLSGIGFGSFFYLLAHAFMPHWIPITPMSTITLFVMSAIIGELSFLFESEMSWAVVYPLHCILTFALVCGWIAINGWGDNALLHAFPYVLATFVVIYALVWLILISYNFLTARRINRRLRK